MTNEQGPTISAEHAEQSMLIQHDLTEYFDRQLAEGMPVAAILAGLCAAILALLRRQPGGENDMRAVRFFSSLAAMLWRSREAAADTKH